MKRIAITLAAASIFAACSNNDPLVKGSRTEIDSVKIVQESIRNIKDSLRLDSFEKTEIAKKQQLQEQAAQRASYRPVTRSHKVGSSSSSRSTNYQSQPVVQAQPVKKGWSSAAKGAAIGAGAGAVTGVLVDKKDGRGAIIGGVVGAGTGYVIGRSRDRKSGRVQRSN
ncbi:MAG TPA: YMGG-like glycine zipper-containing protein [Sphingobacteriaceae bacterium]|nr:YMGG-like glycine zipper-containing protein [Sphingobacteriaceae bacterium]